MATTAPHKPVIPAIEFNRIIDNQTADTMLREHARWLESGGREGRRANFKNKICRGVDFRRSLAQAEFQGAMLEGCTFRPGVDLTEADFSEANLTAIDLSGTRNLAEHRLGASKLSYAKLPPHVAFEGLTAIKELSARAEKILFALLASCATVVVLSRVIPHRQLFLQAQSITLPVLGLPVPVRTFYNLAPWLLLIPYAYLLSTLLKLWSTQRDLPAILPSHRMLFREVPASPNFCVMPFGWCWRRFPHRDRKRREENAEVLSVTRMDRWLVTLLVWWVVPLTIAWLWLSYLPRHAFVDSLIQIIAVALAVGLSVASYARMLANLTRGFRDWTRPVYLPAPWSETRRIRISKLTILLYPRNSSPRRSSGPQKPRAAADAPPAAEASRNAPHRATERNLRYSLVTTCMALVLLSLGGFSWAALRADGCSGPSRYGRERGPCYWLAANLPRVDMDSLQLSEQNLRRAFMPGAQLKDARLEDALLQGAQLSDIDAEDAVLKDARLEGAVLWEADLDKANLKEAHFEGADLRGASLVRARMQGVYLEGTLLRGANMDSAIVCGAHFSNEATVAHFAAQVFGEEIRGGRFHDGVLGKGQLPTMPGYLTDAEDQEGFRRWSQAEQQVERLAVYIRRQAPEGRLQGDSLQRLVRDIDLSMGASTQRKQIHLHASLESFAGTFHQGWIRYTPKLRAILWDFIADVQRKARNHCVLPARASLPVPGPSLAPSSVWNAKVGTAGPSVTIPPDAVR